MRLECLIAGYVLSMFVLVVSVYYRRHFKTVDSKGQIELSGMIFGISALAIGLFIRAKEINVVESGHHMYEELNVSIVYVAGILNLKPVLSGATNIVFFY